MAFVKQINDILWQNGKSLKFLTVVCQWSLDLEHCGGQRVQWLTESIEEIATNEIKSSSAAFVKPIDDIICPEWNALKFLALTLLTAT